MSYKIVAKYALTALWVALMPIRPAMASVLMLPLVDLILALVVARRGKVAITSTGLKRTVGKVLMYETATILAFVVETSLTGPWVPVVKMVTGLIGMTELKSCLEHLDELGGQPLFASLLSRLAPPQPPDKDTSHD